MKVKYMTIKELPPF